MHDARTLFLVDDELRLCGRVPVQALALARLDTRLAALAEPVEARVDALAPRGELVELLTRTGLTDLPVVDLDGRLLGTVPESELLAAVQLDAAGDMQAMVGASRDERALSGPGFAVRKRLPWLQINLLTAFLAASVVGLFESTIASYTALAVLLPVVAGQSGNAGAQALAVTMRGLALREITTRHAGAGRQGAAGRRAQRHRRGSHHRGRRVRLERLLGPGAGDRGVDGAVDDRRRPRRRARAHRAAAPGPGPGDLLVDHPDHGHRRRRLLLLPRHRHAVRVPAVARACRGRATRGVLSRAVRRISQRTQRSSRARGDM
ncbi:MAG: hypothetical protein U5K43_12860 [Halofilum sp. (in: g-proteobacteria)]|nr:hypothetical protein [Halofilum sp. (in: g-proteobacteria)]